MFFWFLCMNWVYGCEIEICLFGGFCMSMWSLVSISANKIRGGG